MKVELWGAGQVEENICETKRSCRLHANKRAALTDIAQSSHLGPKVEKAPMRMLVK